MASELKLPITKKESSITLIIESAKTNNKNQTSFTLISKLSQQTTILKDDE